MFKEEFIYEESDGTQKTIILRPLPIAYIGDIWDIQKKFISQRPTKKEKELYNKLDSGKELTEEEEEILIRKESESMNRLSSEDIKTVATLCLVSVEKSCPSWNEKERDDFVANHFWNLFPVVLKVNTRR